MNRTLAAERHQYGLVDLWQNRHLGVALAVGIAVLAGLLVSVALPHGPTTQAQALLVLAGGALVGALAGLAMRSR